MIGRDNGCRHIHTHMQCTFFRSVGPSFFVPFFTFMSAFMCLCVCVHYKSAQPVRNNDYDEGDDDRRIAHQGVGSYFSTLLLSLNRVPAKIKHPLGTSYERKRSRDPTKP